jgi:hypothetical protein
VKNKKPEESAVIEQDDKHIGSILSRLLLRLRANLVRDKCLGEENLAVYLSGDLTDAQRNEIEEHLVSCSVCVDEIVAAHQAAQAGEAEPIPQHLLNRAMALVPSSRVESDILQLVVQLAKDSLDLISTSGEVLLPPAPAAIRGKETGRTSGIVQVSKQLEKFTITVEVERTENEFSQVSVSVIPTQRTLADGLRFSLMSGGREQASYLARQGAATFDRVPPGEYELALSDSGTPLGGVQLTIKEDSRE